MVDLATQLLMAREGFSRTPYTDNDGRLRVGYGSDTYTTADGVVHQVSGTTVVTQPEAARDLARRMASVQQGIVSDVGQDAWNRLSEGAQAALTSVAYNYGSLDHLPSIVAAAQSGDNQAIADAIAARGGDNGGINAARRAAEAATVLGHPVPPSNIPTTTTNTAGPDDRPSMASLYGAAPAPLTPPKVDGVGTALPSFADFQAQLGLNTTPLPVPRPATPLQAPPVPMPMPTPSWLQPTASQPASTAQHLVNLNGKMVPVGTYPSPSNPGSTVTVSDDGTGKAVVKNNDPGLAGGIGPGTVAGSIIGQKIGQAADAAKAGAATALGNAGNTLNGAKDQIGALGSNIVSGAGSLLSGLFGNKPPNVPSPPASYLGAANSNGAKANGTDSFTPALGSSTSGALGNATGAKANDTDGFAPVTTTVRNPAYDAWFAQYGNQGGLATGTSENTVSAKFNDTDGSAPPVAPKPVPLAPPKYITKTVQGNSSGGGQQQSSPPPQTFSGSSTGRTYTVGQTYSNNNGTYVAQANGTFARVGSAQSTPSAHQASGSQPSPALAMNGQPIRATGGY